jgi:hypothetical protein
VHTLKATFGLTIKKEKFKQEQGGRNYLQGSDLEECTLCNSTIGRAEGVEVGNGGFQVGDE